MPINKPLLVGITGGIGSGKSLVCKIFELFGIPVYNSDVNAKRLMAEDPKLIENIKRVFGEEAYLGAQQLNREFLASKVFSNPDKLEQLNSLVHPAVASDFKHWTTQHSDKPYVLKEAALLFESGSYKSLDSVILVTAAADLRIRRVVSRDPHRSTKQVKDIMANQMSDDEKIPMSDYVLVNDEKKLLIPEVVKIHELLKARTATRAVQGA